MIPTNEKEQLVYLGLGSNIQPEVYLPKAVACLGRFLNVVAMSSTWQTKAVGSSGPDFLNAVISVSTELSPEDLKYQITCRIEEELDRVRISDRNAPRTIDIDVLIYDNQVLDAEIWRQAHLAVPLSEILPGIIEPNTGKTLESIANQLHRQTPIKPCPSINLELLE
jgi:2-amino-4-hydroxy-6-hydroxymethyldihydropteridine diphosphokinase